MNTNKGKASSTQSVLIRAKQPLCDERFRGLRISWIWSRDLRLVRGLFITCCFPPDAMYTSSVDIWSAGCVVAELLRYASVQAFLGVSVLVSVQGKIVFFQGYCSIRANVPTGPYDHRQSFQSIASHVPTQFTCIQVYRSDPASSKAAPAFPSKWRWMTRLTVCDATPPPPPPPLPPFDKPSPYLNDRPLCFFIHPRIPSIHFTLITHTFQR